MRGKRKIHFLMWDSKKWYKSQFAGWFRVWKKEKMLHHQLLETLSRQQLCSGNKQVNVFELILYLLYLYIIILFVLCTSRTVKCLAVVRVYRIWVRVWHRAGVQRWAGRRGSSSPNVSDRKWLRLGLRWNDYFATRAPEGRRVQVEAGAEESGQGRAVSSLPPRREGRARKEAERETAGLNHDLGDTGGDVPLVTLEANNSGLWTVCRQPLGASAVQIGRGGCFEEFTEAEAFWVSWKGVGVDAQRPGRGRENTFARNMEGENVFLAWQKKHFSEQCPSSMCKKNPQVHLTEFVFWLVVVEENNQTQKCEKMSIRQEKCQRKAIHHAAFSKCSLFHLDFLKYVCEGQHKLWSYGQFHRRISDLLPIVSFHRQKSARKNNQQKKFDIQLDAACL